MFLLADIKMIVSSFEKHKLKIMVLHTFHELEKGSMVHVPQSSFCKPPTPLKNSYFVSVDAILMCVLPD